jgi:hypothetical protein
MPPSVARFVTLYSHDPNSEVIDNLQKLDYFITRLKSDSSIENLKWTILAVHMVVQSIALTASSIEDQTLVLKKKCNIAGINTELDFTINERFIVTPDRIQIGRAFYIEDIEPFIDAIRSIGKNSTRDIIIDRINGMYHLKSLSNILTDMISKVSISQDEYMLSDFKILCTKIQKLSYFRDGFIHFHPWKQIFDHNSIKEAIQDGIKISILILRLKPNLYENNNSILLDSLQSNLNILGEIA